MKTKEVKEKQKDLDNEYVGFYIKLTRKEKRRMILLSRKYEMTLTDLVKQQVFLLPLRGKK